MASSGLLNGIYLQRNKMVLQTWVSTIYNRTQLELLEKMIEMGFTEGFKMSSWKSWPIPWKHNLNLERKWKQARKARVCTYLNFPGNTEEAFLFTNLFLNQNFPEGFTADLGRYSRLNRATQLFPKKIKKEWFCMWSYQILGGHILMATDAPKKMGQGLYDAGTQHAHLSLNRKQ